MIHDISIGFLDDEDFSIAESTDGDSDINGNSKIRPERGFLSTMINRPLYCKGWTTSVQVPEF